MFFDYKVLRCLAIFQISLEIISSVVHCNFTAQLNLRRVLFGNLSDKTNHKVYITPRKYENEPLPVNVSLTVISLISYSEKDEVLVSNGILKFQWNDFHLAWNESWYEGVKTLFVPQMQIWKPDLRLENTVENHKQLGDDYLLAKVSSGGNVDWEPGDVFHTSCAMDITLYPLDEQNCGLKFCTRMNTTDQVSISVSSDTIVFQNPYDNGQWEILGSKAEKTNTPDGSGCIIFSMHIKRRPYFYIINTLMPIMMMSFINSFVFLLPIESGEKISMCTALLLSFAVFLGFITDSMPNTSTKPSLLGIYVGAMLLLSGLAIIVIVLMAICYHRREEEIADERDKARKPTFIRKPRSQIQNMWQSLIGKKQKVDPVHENPPSSTLSARDGQRGDETTENTKPNQNLSRGRGKRQRISPAKKLARSMDFFCFILFFTIASAGTITLLGMLNIGKTGLSDFITGLVDEKH